MRELRKRHAPTHRKYRRFALFVEKARLGSGGCSHRWLTAGDSHDSQNGDFGKSAARDEDSVGRGVQVWGSDLQSIIQ